MGTPAGTRGRGLAWLGRLAVLAAAALLLAGCYDTLERVLYGVKPGVTLGGRPVGGYLAPEVRRAALAMAREGRREPRLAAIDRATGAIIPEQPGRELDVAATVEAVMAAPEGTRVEPRWLEVSPRVTGRDLQRLTAVLGQYATWIGGSEARYHNIGHAARIIDRTLLYPGQEFSFWEVLGPTTVERGFRLAPVIVGEAFVPGPGGGVCQVSSTLYNAALAARLEVTERHPHSKPVRYVPLGRDAAVAYDYLNLRFRNTTDHPVLVRAHVANRRIWFAVLGPPEAARTAASAYGSGGRDGPAAAAL